MNFLGSFSDKFKGFMLNKTQQDLFSLVKENPNIASYNITMNASALNTYADLQSVPDMLTNAVINSCLALIMETAFQTNANQDVFWVKSKYRHIKELLDDFHTDNNFQQLALDIGYNLLLWGNLGFKHKFDEDDKLIGVHCIPRFDRIIPIILSGVNVGYVVDNEYRYPFEYTFAQLQYYKNLGGLQTGFTSLMSGDTRIENEFVYSPSYLSAAAQAWRNINIIKDALLLHRMDMSNYYRIISVDVGGSVYSKAAIKVLNFYRNLFKNVRRVSYDPQGMSARGMHQEFEVIIPKSQNQGVTVEDIGGQIEVRALADLDVMYNELFGALRVQPSQIGFSSDAPAALNGEGPAVLWDKRLARTCKTLVYSTMKAIKDIDLVFLRSRGYDVKQSDWGYGTLSGSQLEDNDKQEALSSSVNVLKSLQEQFGQMEVNYNKNYLIEAVLGETLSSVGLNVQRLFDVSEQENEEPEAINSSLYTVKPFTPNQAKLLLDSSLLTAEQCKSMTAEKVAINSSIDRNPTLKEVTSKLMLLPSNAEVNIDEVVQVLKDTTVDTIKETLTKRNSDTISIPIPNTVLIPSDLDSKVSVGDLQASVPVGFQDLVLYKGNAVIISRDDLLSYLAYKNSQQDYATVLRLWRLD